MHPTIQINPRLPRYYCHNKSNNNTNFTVEIMDQSYNKYLASSKLLLVISEAKKETVDVSVEVAITTTRRQPK